MKHRTLLSAAAFAYRPFNSEILCKDLSGFEAQWFRNEDTDTEVIILTGKGDCIVAFRGTEIKERKDIKTDLRFWPCRFRHGTAHKGFIRSYYSIRTALLRELARHAEHNRIYVTGHSLGGALAQLCMLDLARTRPGFDLRTCVVFGAPRVFSRATSRAYDREVGATTRYVNAWDWVPRVPFLAGFYRHTRKLVHFDSDGIEVAGWRAIFRKIPRVVGGALDHPLEQYEAAFDKWEQRFFDQIAANEDNRRQKRH